MQLQRAWETSMRQIVLCTIATAFLCAFLGDSAQAQPTRVFVAAQGLDSNPCSFAQPCRTFQKGHDTVAAGGEIDVLDPAGYGSVVINKAISIQAHGFAGVTVGSGETAITINANPNDAVNLTGLLIEGAGVGKYGIVFNSGKSLSIENCMVRNLTDYGINFVPTGSSRLAVSSTLVANIGIGGIAVGSAGSGTVTAALNR